MIEKAYKVMVKVLLLASGLAMGYLLGVVNAPIYY